MAGLLSHGASAAVVETRVHGDAGDDYIVSCDAGPFTADYAAETASGESPESPYAVARGADKGLVRLMSRGGTPTQHYIVPRGDIRAIVKVRVDSVILDRADLVFTAPHLILIHTATADAGVFTSSDVYELPYRAGGHADTAAVRSNRDLLQMLNLGLSAYRSRGNICVR
jgi:hypothetical protein